MIVATFLVVTAMCAVGSAQQQYTTPVPILKQINKHNEDGSYSYGYEAADGSFKIESKYPDGQVFGKYGYVDESGKVRQVEYGASKRGFEPAGSGINVPPPTLTQNNQITPLGPNEQDDGQYREDPSIYYKNEEFNRPAPQTAFRPQSNFKFYNSQPSFQQPQQNYNSEHQSQQQYYSPPQQNQYYNPPQNDYYNPAGPQAYNRQPIQVDPNLFRGHPASNFDVNTGSYSINYTGRK